jgi:hypothetical protein
MQQAEELVEAKAAGNHQAARRPAIAATGDLPQEDTTPIVTHSIAQALARMTALNANDAKNVADERTMSDAIARVHGVLLTRYSEREIMSFLEWLVDPAVSELLEMFGDVFAISLLERLSDVSVRAVAL